MAGREVTISECGADDLSALAARMPSPTGRPGVHADRYQAQGRGRCAYLVARLDGAPVGHALLEWTGCLAPEVYADFLGVPEVCSLLVVPERRGAGIGTALIAEAERRALAAGRDRLGIGVAATNRRAAALYARLGYRRVRSYLNRWTVTAPDGGRRQVTEPTEYLVKELSSAPSAERRPGRR